jgi:hypothetical protein
MLLQDEELAGFIVLAYMLGAQYNMTCGYGNTPCGSTHLALVLTAVHKCSFASTCDYSLDVRQLVGFVQA